MPLTPVAIDRVPRRETTMVRFRRALILAGPGVGVAIAAVVTLDKFVLLVGASSVL